jgi:hypothetical protein
MATLLKVLNNLADIKSARGVALRVRTQGALGPVFSSGENRSESDTEHFAFQMREGFPLRIPIKAR